MNFFDTGDKEMTNTGNNIEYRAVESMLYNYTNLKAQIKNLELDIEEEENNYCTLSAVQYDRESISKTNKFNSEVENRVIKLDKAGTNERVRFLQAKKRSKEIQIERIDNILSVLSKEEYDLIKLRYFQGMQFKDIADILLKSDLYLQQKRRKIINDKLIPLFNL